MAAPATNGGTIIIRAAAAAAEECSTNSKQERERILFREERTHISLGIKMDTALQCTVYSCELVFRKKKELSTIITKNNYHAVSCQAKVVKREKDWECAKCGYHDHQQHWKGKEMQTNAIQMHSATETIFFHRLTD